ncbi:MAG: hypothetical protein ACXWMO_03260 [Syntrophales bacterium]
MIPEQKEISLPALFCSMLLQRARDFVIWIFFACGLPLSTGRAFAKSNYGRALPCRGHNLDFSILRQLPVYVFDFVGAEIQCAVPLHDETERANPSLHAVNGSNVKNRLAFKYSRAVVIGTFWNAVFLSVRS